MRICIDIDGTICKNKKDDQSYIDVDPIENAVKSIQNYKENGHYIILYTSRGMKTYNNSIGRITAINGPILIEWLKKHNIPYDEIIFGKPLADIYIDDKAITFENWEKINNVIKSI